MSEELVGFEKLGLDGERVSLDAASLMHACARWHQEPYLQGNYAASAREFQGVLVYLMVVRRYSLYVSLDGVDPEGKTFEHERREAGDGPHIRNTSDYIAICAKICRMLHVPFKVAPQEANFQAVKTAAEHNMTVITSDGNLIAYGSRRTVIVGSWRCPNEKYRVIDLTKVPRNVAECSVLYRAYRLYGVVAFAVWAAVCGYDSLGKPLVSRMLGRLHWSTPSGSKSPTTARTV